MSIRCPGHLLNRQLPSFPGPLYQNEAKCSAFDMKMVSHSHTNKTIYWAACAPSHKMDFRSSVSKSGLPGEGRHEGLVPRNDVLTNGFI